MFNGIFPIATLVTPAGVIRRPLTSTLEDFAEGSEPHPKENRIHRAISAIMAVIG
jgi:hypothetical protein